MKISNSKNVLFVIILVTLIGLPLFAGNDLSKRQRALGTERTKYLLMMHEKHIQELSPTELSSASKSVDIGNVAVITGDQKTFFPRNLFDLTGRKISFIPNASGGYDVKTSTGTISATQGNSIPVSSISKRITFTSGFSFSYYGITYTSVLVNGCGNVSFAGKGSSCNSLFGYLSGPPIIVPFEGSYPDEVRILQTSTKFQVTWKRTSPDSPTRPVNQVNLLKDGTIEFLYGGNYTDSGTTGISPGNVTFSSLEVVNFSSGSTHRGGANTAFFELFRTEPGIDSVALLQEFHRTHPHNFDFVTIFTDRSYPYEDRGSFWPIQNSIRGIGVNQFNDSESFGSSQIQGFIMMNSLADYPSDPTAPLHGTYNTLQLMAELHGERWLPYPQVMINGVKKNDLLGYYKDYCQCSPSFAGRWNFFMDTDASVMGGNDIADNGNGTFTTTSSTLRYSNLDQYLMGLVPSSAVLPFFYAGTEPEDFFGSLGSGSEPKIGVTFSGTRVNVNVNQVIQAEGKRNPSSQESQKKFREAFIYFIRPGSHPDPAQISKIERIRTGWQGFFKNATDQHGTMNTVLK